ncbi:copper chaperone PCu(A)C [Sphingopyxis sp. P1IMeth2]|uniref:copper chaperone PCu(A)C n=1 Tax=unclassified Sphingopyxis TaxID=2614943 RepID=UPI001647B12A|nr:copper chaperone PCu(A)C [Sphingopyxis sp. P1IMeth2]
MKPFAIAALAASALALTGCNGKIGSDPQLAVVAGYIQMGATPDSPAAGYFTIKGGPQDVELVAVTADLAQRVEMHESVKENGVVTMKPLTTATVPAKGELEFKPGGKHLMIWHINGAAVRAGKLPMQFVFTNYNNDRILFDLPIKPAPGASADGSGDAPTGAMAGMEYGSMDHGAANTDAAKK